MQLGLPPPGPLEMVPVCGAASMVFLLGPYALKFIVHEVGGVDAAVVGWVELMRLSRSL